MLVIKAGLERKAPLHEELLVRIRTKRIYNSILIAERLERSDKVSVNLGKQNTKQKDEANDSN